MLWLSGLPKNIRRFDPDRGHRKTGRRQLAEEHIGVGVAGGNAELFQHRRRDVDALFVNVIRGPPDSKTTWYRNPTCIESQESHRRVCRGSFHRAAAGRYEFYDVLGNNRQSPP